MFDCKLIGSASNTIVNEVLGNNRAIYYVTSNPLGTIEWE